MQKKHILPVICIILILVVLGALKKIESKIDSIEQQLADQGERITKLYNFVDRGSKLEIEIEDQDGQKDSIILDKPFPALEFKDLNENTVDISKLIGKVVLIDFWATWCGPCTAETPNLLSVYDEFKDKGFEIIGISLDKDRQKLESYLKKHEIQWSNYYDGKGWQNEISSRFGVHGIPKMVLLDRDGIVKENGLRGSKIREAVAGLLGEDIKKHSHPTIDPKDWKEEYIVELNTVDDITSSKFGVNWFRPHRVENISPEKPDFIKSLPTFKHDMQRYLTFRLGDAEENQIFAVVDFREPEQKHFPFDLYMDRGRDGNLATDFIEDSRLITDIQVPYKDNTTEGYSLYLYSYSDKNPFGFAYQCKAGRYGIFDVGQTKAQLLVIDNNGNGIFNDSEDVILMDWDLDGKIDGSHQADEEVPLYSLLELPGATYQVAEFDPAGRHMVLKLIGLKDQVPKEDSQKLIEQQVVKDGRLKIIKTDPALPASLNLGEKLKIQFEYDLGSAEKVQIWARPYTNGRLTQGYKAHGSPVYNREEKNAGGAEGYFFFDRPTVVDEVRIQMKDAARGATIYTLSEKIDAKWVEGQKE